MPRTLLISAAALILMLAGLAYLLARRPGPVEHLTLPGTVEIQEVHLGPRVAGRVASLLVQEGDLVEPGREIVRLEVPDLAARSQQARAKLELTEAQLQEARNGPRVQEREAAHARVAAVQARLDLLRAGARREEIERANADLASARADLWAAEREWEREKELIGRNASSPADYELAAAARDRLKGHVNSARAYLDLLLAGSRPEAIAEAEAELRRARAESALLEAGTRPEVITAAAARAAEAKAALDEAEFLLAEARVVAPERVLIEVVAVRPGDLVQPNQPVVRALRASDLWVKAYVPETQIGKLRLNQQVGVTSDSFPDKTFQGKLIQIASISEFTPRNVQSADERRHQVFAIKVRVDDPSGIFKSGMAAEVRVPLMRIPSETTP